MQISKLIFFFALLFPLPFGPTSALADTKEDLQACIQQLKECDATVRRQIPREVFEADRKLLYMSRGVPFLEANSLSVLARAQGEGGGPLDGILLSNAVEGCRHYLKAFERRSLRFRGLLILLLLMVGVLTLRVLLFMVSLVKQRGGLSHAYISTSAPTAATRDPDDRDRSSHSRGN